MGALVLVEILVTMAVLLVVKETTVLVAAKTPAPLDVLVNV